MFYIGINLISDRWVCCCCGRRCSSLVVVVAQACSYWAESST